MREEEGAERWGRWRGGKEGEWKGKRGGKEEVGKGRRGRRGRKGFKTQTLYKTARG